MCCGEFFLKHALGLTTCKSQSAFNLGRLLAALIIPGVKAAHARLYSGILWPGPIYTSGISYRNRIVIVDSRLLERPQKRREPAYSQELNQNKIDSSVQNPESQAGRQPDGY